MPSGSKRRKAAKKKKEKETGLHVQTPSQASGNENENEDAHASEEDAITPKTPVQTNDGEEKGGSQVQQEDNHAQCSSIGNYSVESTDISLAAPENGGRNENELEVLSGGALHKNAPIENLGPVTDTEEGHPKRSRDGHEIDQGGLETRTEVGLIGLGGGNESEDLSSKVVLHENEPNQTTGLLTDVPELSPKDDTYTDMGNPSLELESSDGDESNLDIASTLAVFDTNESIQSVGSVESPRSSLSISSLKFPDQTSNERAVLISQDQDDVSEGISETPFQDLSSESESADAPVYNVQIDTIELIQEEDEKESSLSPEVLKGFRYVESIQIPVEAVSDNYAIREEEFSESVVNCENTQGVILISSAITNKESEAISTELETITKTLVVPLLKSESSNMRGVPVISTGGEAGGDLISTGGEASRDLISIGEEASTGLISTGGEASGCLISTGGEASGCLISTGGEASRCLISTSGEESSGARRYLISTGEEDSRDVGSIGETNSDVVSTGREASGDVVSTGREARGDVVLAGEEVCGDVVSAGGEACGDVVLAGGEAHGDVVSAGGEAHGDVVSAGGEARGDVVSAGGEARGDVVSAGGEACGDVVSADGEACGDVVLAGGEASGDLVSIGGEASGDLVSTGGEASGDLVSTGGEASGDLVSTGGEASGDLVSTGGEASGDLVSTGGEASGDLVWSGREASGNLVSTGREASGDVVLTDREASSDVVSIGREASSDVVLIGREASGDVVSIGRNVSSTGREASGDVVSITGGDVVYNGGKFHGDVVYNGGKFHGDVVSYGGEALGDVVSNGGQVLGDVVANSGEACGDVFSTGGEADRNNLRSSQVQGTSIDSKEISNKISHPENEQNEKATLLQRETQTSWLSCCGILELFTGTQS